MSMSNNMCGERVHVTVMATARHPTVDADEDDAALDADHEADPSDHHGVGIAHTTVVPTNFERDD